MQNLAGGTKTGPRTHHDSTLYPIRGSAVDDGVNGSVANVRDDTPKVAEFDPVEQARSRIGTLIDDKYELIELIGLGATGAVYKARNRWAGRVCALKLFRYQGCNELVVMQRFVREAQAIHRVQSGGKLHPHVVDAIDVGRDAETGCCFVVQELLRGETLSAYLDRLPGRRLSQANALRILRPIIDAIACAHQGGVVHRDLKPDNILLTRGGTDGIFPKVLDFGLAQISNERVTPVNDFMGTPQYMPPEAFCGANLHDARGDVWALGVILYEVLAGRLPFECTSDDPMELKARLETTSPPSLAALGVASAPVWSVVRRALAKQPLRRYANARELLDALDDAQRPLRKLRVLPGMDAKAVRRALHDPAHHGPSMNQYVPPIDPSEHPKVPARDAAVRQPGRSMFPQRSLAPPPVSSPPLEQENTFLGDPSRHWWCVHFLASGHGSDELLEILSLPELAQLAELHVFQCPLGDEGVLRLVEGPYLRNVQALTLCKVDLSSQGTLALARAPTLSGVVRLDLEQNPIGTKGLRTLLASRHLANLRALGLALTGLEADAASALIESPKFDRLQHLDLSQNFLGDRGVLAFCDYDMIPRELHLTLARNRASRSAIEQVIARLRPKIRKLVI